MPTKTSWCTTRSQNGSNSGSANDRGPRKPGTGAGRIRIAAGTALDAPLELLDRLLDDRQRDHRSGEDAVLVVESPHLVEPLVERVDDDVDGDRIVGETLLDEAGQRREHQRAVDAELVHHLEARSGLEEGRDGAHRLAEQFALALAVGVAELEVFLPRARLGDDRERRVRDVVADLAPQRNLGAAVDLDVLDEVLVLLGEELGHRLRRLIEVVVRVKNGKRDVDPMRQLTHEILLMVVRTIFSLWTNRNTQHR